MNIEVAKLSLVNGKQYNTPSEMNHAEVRDGMLYVMVEVSAPMAEWDNVSRELVARVIETFATSQLIDSQALNEAATDINNYLIAHNDILPQSKQVWAGVNMFFIRDNQLLLAQAGPALTYIIRDQLVTRYPPSNPKQMPIPMGEQHDLPCRLAELELQTNDMIVLVASHLPFRVSEEVVHETMQYDTLDEIITNLVDVAKDEDFSALAVQYDPMPEMAGHRSTPVVIAPPTIPLQLAGMDGSSQFDEDVEEKEDLHQKPLSNQPDEPSIDVQKNHLSDHDTIQEKTDEAFQPTSAQESGQSLIDSIADYVSQLPDYAPASTPKTPTSDEWHQDRSEHQPAPSSASRAVPPAAQPPAEASPAYSYSAAKKAAPPYQATQPPRAGREGARAASAPHPHARQANRASSPNRHNHDPSSAAHSRASAVNDPAPSTPFTDRAASRTDQSRPDGKRAERSRPTPSLGRRIGIGLLAMLAWMLGALSAAVGGLHNWLTPRLAQIVPLLDGAAHVTWHGSREFLSTSVQSLRQVLPGYQKRPRKAKRPIITPAASDGTEFMRLATIAIPIVLLLIGLTFWTIRGETEPVLAEGEVETEALAEEEEATADAAQEEQLANALGEAKKRLEMALSSGPEIARNLLGEAKELLTQAEALTEQNPPKRAEVVALQLEVEQSFDQLNNVKRPVTMMLAALQPNSRPKELIYGANTLFVWVDDAIYRVDASQRSTDILQNNASLLQAGQALPSEETINGNPKALTWVTQGNGRPYDAMILLTENGQLIEYERSLEQMKILAGATFDTKTQAAEAYSGNLYLLDRSQRQIWKYTPDQTGGYTHPADGWVAITDHDNMGRPVDLAIDGYIFVLDEGGQVRRFQTGTLYGDFALQAVEPPLNQGVALAKVLPDESDIFVADSERIIRFTANGQLVSQYRAPLDGSPQWGQIYDITIPPEGNELYVLGDNGIYVLDLLNVVPPPEQPAAPEPTPDAMGPQTEEESNMFEESEAEE